MAHISTPVDSLLPSVSVIVINLNGQQFLTQCLDSIYDQEYPGDKVEIILVDNGSTDDSVEFIQEQYPKVRIIAAGQNLGFSGGNNCGAEAATGDYLALLNNDAWAEPNWLQTMVQAAQNNVACIASRMLDETGQTIDFAGSVMNLYGRAFQRDALWRRYVDSTADIFRARRL